jgi:hypothetical protein
VMVSVAGVLLPVAVEMNGAYELDREVPVPSRTVTSYCCCTSGGGVSAVGAERGSRISNARDGT